MAAVKYPHKIEYIGFSERTQNILLFELSIVNPIYLECQISRTPRVYGSIIPAPPQIEILALNIRKGDRSLNAPAHSLGLIPYSPPRKYYLVEVIETKA